jgi:hypothetical protein
MGRIRKGNRTEGRQNDTPARRGRMSLIPTAFTNLAALWSTNLRLCTRGTLVPVSQGRFHGIERLTRCFACSRFCRLARVPSWPTEYRNAYNLTSTPPPLDLSSTCSVTRPGAKLWYCVVGWRELRQLPIAMCKLDAHLVI